jgi:hypothetical protein
LEAPLSCFFFGLFLGVFFGKVLVAMISLLAKKSFTPFQRGWTVAGVRRVAAGKIQPLDRIGELAKIVEKDLPPKASLQQILQAVWTNETVTNQCPNLVIRLTSLRGEVRMELFCLFLFFLFLLPIFAIWACSSQLFSFFFFFLSFTVPDQ